MRELRAAGATAVTVGRMVESGEVLRTGRGLYRLGGSAASVWHSFAEAAKRLPRGVVCLESALAWHGLVDDMPSVVWMAVGNGDWAPRGGTPPIRAVRFADRLLSDSVRIVKVDGVDVKIFGVEKTIADCFRHRRRIGRDIALKALREAVWRYKAMEGDIDEAARRGRVGNLVGPYIVALTSNNARLPSRPEGRYPVGRWLETFENATGHV